MPRISERDLARVTAFLVAARAGSASDPLPRPLLAALCDLVGAEEAEYFELRRADRAVIALAESRDFESAPGSDEALRAYGHQNPIGWRRWRPADGPMRLSARIGRRALRRTAFYNEGMRPNGLTDALKVWLHSDAASVACVQLWQRGRTFTARQEDIIGVLQSHLVRLRQSVTPERVPATTLGLTRREAEVLTWAVRGVPDTEIADRLGLSVGTVGKHLEHAFASLDVHSRAEALWRLQAGSPAGGHAAKPPSSSVVGSPGEPAG